MALQLSSLKKGLNLSSLKLVLYGEEKVGKSTFCSQMPEPIFIDIEEGTNFLDVTRINKNDIGKDWDYDSFIEVLTSIRDQEHDYKTLVIDSIDWLETLIQVKIKRDHTGAKSYLDATIKALAYGGGTAMLNQYIRETLELFDEIRSNKHMNIVLIAHTKKKSETDVMGASFDKAVLKLTEKTEGVCLEWADFVLYARKKQYTVEEKDGMNVRNRAISQGKSIIYTSKNPSFSGGGRVELPEELPLEWPAFQAALHASIGKLKQQSANVA